jgi:hypothetical protein
MDAPPRRRRTGIVVAAVVVVLALVGAFTFISTRGDDRAQAQALALSFTQGDSASYAIHLTMNGSVSGDAIGGDQPLDLDMTEHVTWAVTSVDDHGVATIRLTVDDISGTVDGAAMPTSAASVPPITFEVSPDGRIVSAGGLALGGAGQTNGFGFPGMSQLTPILPGGDAVAPGDTWHKTFSQPFPFGGGSISYTADSTYVRNDSVGGRQAAVIATDLGVPIDITLKFRDLLDALGSSGNLPTGATGLDLLGDASIAEHGSGSVHQTSWVDLDAEDLLRSTSHGSFHIAMTFQGVPQLSDGSAMSFEGTFTQELTKTS